MVHEDILNAVSINTYIDFVKNVQYLFPIKKLLQKSYGITVEMTRKNVRMLLTSNITTKKGTSFLQYIQSLYISHISGEFLTKIISGTPRHDKHVEAMKYRHVKNRDKLLYDLMVFEQYMTDSIHSFGEDVDEYLKDFREYKDEILQYKYTLDEAMEYRRILDTGIVSINEMNNIIALNGKKILPKKL